MGPEAIDAAAIARARPAADRARLAISGLAARWRKPGGHEEAMLAEGRADDPALALALVRAVSRLEDDHDPGDLPVPDVDALVCHIRASQLGDRVVADLACADPGCGKRIDIRFRLSDYIAHHRPAAHAGRRAAPVAERPGWLRLGGHDPVFRLPRFADLVAATQADDPDAALAERCFDPPAPLARQRRKAEQAMAALAPMLAGPLGGACFECGAPIAARFEARSYCMQELCDRARFVFEDVDVIAARYHWSEQAILDMPAERRAHYAELARRASPAGLA